MESPNIIIPPQSLTTEIREIVANTYGNKFWRMQNLYFIRDKNRRLTPLKYNRVQRNIIADVLPSLRAGRPIRHFTLKARQQGVSTFWMLWWLDDTITHTNTITAALAHQVENIKTIMGIVRMAYENLPPRWRPPLQDDSKQKLSFPTLNSEFMSGLRIRSQGIHNLHISEWCLCEDEEVQATLAATSELTNISGESTGNGVGNDGYITYQQAKLGESEYKARFFPWFFQEEYRSALNGAPAPTLTVKERKLEKLMATEYGAKLEPEQVIWRRRMEAKLKGLMPQEYPETDEDAFRTAGSKFFDYKKVHRLILLAKEHLKENPPVAEGDDWVQFEKPNKYDIYGAGADTAEGGGDYSVLKIINVSKRREAFVFRARCGVDTLYRAANEWGRRFNNALLGVERNNHGHAVLLGLNETCGYPNLYKEIMGGGQAAIGDKFPKEKLGWLTTGATRDAMLDTLKFAAEGDSLEDEEHFTPEIQVLDIQLLKEMLTFEQIDGKYQAVSGEYDDDVMGSAIAVQMYVKLKRLTIKEGNTNRIQVGGARESTK